MEKINCIIEIERITYHNDENGYSVIKVSVKGYSDIIAAVGVMPDAHVGSVATTIHKSQGSEFPYVVMPLMMSHYMMLQRNLLYTGVTRAKKGLILVGEKKAVYIAVKNNKIVERNTRLAERLKRL